MTDVYQKRYLEHQKRKKEVLAQITKERHSNRVFSGTPVDDKAIKELMGSTFNCPSSCARKGILLDVISERDKKDLLSGLLVGGVGWMHRASHVLLLFGDPLAYKVTEEVSYMPYLDAGFVAHQLYLAATVLELKCCFVSPKIRDMNKEYFQKVFGDKIFCGAFVVGRG